MNVSNGKKSGAICVFGAALDTGNLGVSALCTSVFWGLAQRGLADSIVLFDYSRGYGRKACHMGGENLEISRCGAYHTKRYYRDESLWNIRVSARLGGLGNVAARTIRHASAILDISGGDSFTDLYGPWRFRAITLPKLIALENAKPLILLPQTYGPFTGEPARKTAKRILRASAMAWARDEHSFEALKALLGGAFDPDRHRLGVDVAFGMPHTRPAEALIAGRIEWLEDQCTPLVGFNVSGLLLNRPREAAEQYGFKADYREVIVGFLRRLLRESDARVLLLPHVVTPPGHYESDIEACEGIATALRDESAGRIAVAPVLHDPCEVKWIIAQCDWFCGTRMHSTIAALSSGVPTAAISYSPKTLGVFETCGQGPHVADPRQLSTEEVVNQLWKSWQERESARHSLSAALPHVLEHAEIQMNDILATVLNSPVGRQESVALR